MSLFLVPTSVTKILDNIRRSFLWQGYKKKKDRDLSTPYGLCGKTEVTLKLKMVVKLFCRRIYVVKPGWDITFSRMTNAWEVSRVISFFNLLGTFGCLQEGVD
ncbi:hypothetical protein H5410_015346 [Solanum commersonii]|uniref:Uncharacterized protein n=1 Tax=Solanum commersonii TaxID=4109 RepID=A0A9J5ZU37_SOLCO|nr:hypothetical protein H5410_015346 [Solanum commersonii]